MKIHPFLLSRWIKVAASIFLVVFVNSGCQDKETFSEQQKKIDELSANLNKLASKINLELDEKCSKQASEVFKSEGFNLETADFTNHYNRKLNKCFIEISPFLHKGREERRYLLDAFEHKEYAQLWLNEEPGKNFLPVSYFSNILGEPCNSKEQYTAFVKSLMEE